MPQGWTPPAGWVQPPGWPAAPQDWQWWTPLANFRPVRQPSRYVTTQPKDTSHAFHLIMTLLTCGLWVFIWGGMTVWNAITKDRAVTRIR
jgi:hypothetical protein